LEPRSERNDFRVGAPVLTWPCLFFSLLFFLSCALFTASCSTTSSCDTRRNDIRVPITVLPALTASFLSYSLSSLPLVLCSRTTSNRHKPLPRGSRTPSFLSHFSHSFVCLHLLYSIPITETPEFAATIQKLDTAEGGPGKAARMYIRQPSCSSRRASHRIEFNRDVIPLLPFLLLACVFSPSLGDRPRNSCPHNIGRSLAFALSQSISPLSCFSLSLSPLPGRHFHSRSNYRRYTKIKRNCCRKFEGREISDCCLKAFTCLTSGGLLREATNGASSLGLCCSVCTSSANFIPSVQLLK
jgi:hypothetical protein